MPTPRTTDRTDAHHQAESLARRDLHDQVEELSGLPPERATSVFRELRPEHQSSLLDRLPRDRAGELLHGLRPDERARLLATVEPERERDLIDLLPAGERATTLQLVRYPPESVGRMMTPDVLRLSRRDGRAEALDTVRECGPEVETVYTLPVVDDDRLVGIVDLRALLTAGDGAVVDDVMAEPAATLHPDQDQEVAARLVLTTEALALPVVDDEDRLLGLVTIDDAMEVLELEQTEDALRASGSEPLDQPYLASPLSRLVRSRATWLLAAAVAAILTVNVLEMFEAELAQVVALSLFIPLLLGAGGNAGAQATATVVRALAVDEVRVDDIGRVAWREVRVGAVLGGILGAAAVAPVWLVYDQRLATVVALTLLGVCTIATMIGAVLPVVVDRLGRDPAAVSAPFITTLVDASGLLVYFLIARTVFGL